MLMQTRRNFMVTSSAGMLTALAGCKAPARRAVKGRINKVGIQTYTLREVFSKDPLEALKMIKSAGYDYVELNGGDFSKVPPIELRAMLDDLALPTPATHISLDMLADLPSLIRTLKTLGAKYAIVPWIASELRTLDHWNFHVDVLTQAGKALSDQGLRLAYHNHDFEFDDLGGGTTAMSILLNDVPAEYMDFELDIFWAALANINITTLFRDNPGRFKLCHIKDMGPNKADFVGANYENITRDLMQDVGQGVIPFEDVFALNEISGMEYFIAEHDNPKRPYVDSITTSFNAIKAMRF